MRGESAARVKAGARARAGQGLVGTSEREYGSCACSTELHKYVVPQVFSSTVQDSQTGIRAKESKGADLQLLDFTWTKSNRNVCTV